MPLDEDAMRFNKVMMDQAVIAVQSVGRQYRSNLDELIEELEKTMAYWEAAPKQEFERCRDRWRAEADAHSEKLNNLPRQMEDISGTYGDGERTVFSIWTR